MSTHQDLGDFSNAFRYALAARGELNIIQTSHFAAIDTKKMGVCRIVPMLADSDRFESPDVVSQFRSSQQTDLGHAVEVAENCRAVDTQRRELLCNH